jgi:hypothetical protein
VPTVRTLWAIGSSFRRWWPWQKLRACASLYDFLTGEYRRAWSIFELAQTGTLDIDEAALFPFAPPARMGDPPTCHQTVSYYGRCYHAGAVNYLMWGAANRLCHEEFPTLSPVYTLPWAVGAVVGWKHFDPHHGSDPVIYTALAVSFTCVAYQIDDRYLPTWYTSPCSVDRANRAIESILSRHWSPVHRIW